MGRESFFAQGASIYMMYASRTLSWRVPPSLWRVGGTPRDFLLKLHCHGELFEASVLQEERTHTKLLLISKHGMSGDKDILRKESVIIKIIECTSESRTPNVPWCLSECRVATGL